jgi:hypothetical protein
MTTCNVRFPAAPFLAALMCMVAAGCRDSAVHTSPAAAPNPDAKVLLALDYYEPMYKVDANGRVTHLRLPWRHLPAPVLAEIGKLTELQAIEFTGTTVTDEGLAQLADLQNLRSMSLVNTPITDKGLVHLEKLQSLQWLWLSKNRVTQAAVEKLKKARPDMNVYLL